MQVHRLVQAVTRAQLTADAGRPVEAGRRSPSRGGRPRRPAAARAWPACALLLPHARAVLDLTSGGIWQVAQALGSQRQLPGGPGPVHADRQRAPGQPRTTAPSTAAPWRPAPTSPPGPGRRGMRPGPATSTPPCCPSTSGSPGPEHPETLTTRANLAYWTGNGGGRGRGPRPVRRPAARPRADPRRRPPRHPDRPRQPRPLDRGGGGCGRGPRPVRRPAARPRAGLRPRPPDTLTTRANLACWTGEAGDAAGARDQYAALLPVRERVLGPDHPAP